MKVKKPYDFIGDPKLRGKAEELAKQVHREGIVNADFGTLFDQVESENINLARLEDLDDITVGDKEGFVIDNDVDNEEIIIGFEDGEIETYSYTELNKLLNNDKEKDFQDKGLDAGESYWKITVQIAVKGDVLRGKEGKVFSPMRWDDVSENAQVIVNGEWGGLHTVLARYSKSDLDYVGEYKVGGNYMKDDSTGRGSDGKGNKLTAAKRKALGKKGGHFARGGEINSTVDALKKGDTISIEFGSSFSDGAKVTLKVRSRNKIKKGTIDKITFENKDKPNTVRYYAYERGKGVWGFAKGDMAISNVKIIDAYAEGGSVDVANTILKQIGGRRALVMFTGAKNFIALPNGVSFRIGNRSINYVRITLNGKDLYDVEFALVRGSKMTNKKEFTDVYSDQLKTTFEKATGMYLSFEKGGILSKDEESDFNKWIKDGNANEQSDNVWVEQTTQYKKKFTLDELRTFFKKEYLSYAEGGSIKGRNNKTGETFGVVIGSKKNADDYTEDGKSVNVRTSYGSRISEKQFIFDKDNNLLQIIDFGSSKEGNPDTSGGSSVNINANSKSKSIKAIVERGYNKGFATKVVDYIGESDSYAKGGSTKAKNGKVVSFDFTENTEVLLIIDGKGEEDFFKKGEGFNNIEVISETESKYLLQDTRGYVYEVPKKSVKIVKAYGEGGGIDLVHVYEKDGSLYGTGEIEKKVKGKTYVRFDAQTVKAFDHEQVKPIMKKGGAIKSEYFKGGLSFLNW